MKFGVVVFPGSNCDQDMIGALRYELGQEVVELWHKDNDLSAFNNEDCIVLPGGFSFGDYLRCGAIARFSPMMQETIRFAQKGGKVFGVCNGFQILCEAGLLPGILLKNANQQFICKNVFIKGQDNETLMVPIAHGEGRFHTDEHTLREIIDNDQVMYRYADENGSTTAQSNPNGALFNIAGVSNKTKNVFGMMPHPERACSAKLGNTDGRSVFQALFQLRATDPTIA